MACCTFHPPLSEVRLWNRLIKAGTTVQGIYYDPVEKAWRTGRIARVRRHSPIAWQIQPLGRTCWLDLKSYRQIWVEQDKPVDVSLVPQIGDGDDPLFFG